MKIIIDGKEYKPKDNKINKDDIVVDVHYDRKQGMYAICLRDKNTRYVLSDYEYAKDKKEAQFVKAMMLDDLRNYLDRDYELVEALQQDEKVKDKNGREFNIWTESTGEYEGGYIKIAYVGDNWIDDNDKIIRDNILGYLEYSVLDGNEDKAYVQMINVKESERRKGVATALINSLQNDYKEIDYGYTTNDGTELLHALGIRESVDSELTFKFPNLQQAIDFFWSDRDVNIERVSIEQLVKDNNLLNDWDLESYHQTQWGNKPASEFSIDRNKVNSMRTSEVPYVVRKKDGRLELGDGRHRTRALYNDGYKYVELPVINETLDLSGEISATINSLKKNDKLITPKEINENKSNLHEDKSSGVRVGDEITDKQAKTFYDRGYIDILVKNDKGESKLIPAWHSNETQKELSRELVKDKKTGKDSLKITGNKVDLPKFDQVLGDIKKELGNNIKFYTQSPESNKAYPNEIETDVQDRVTGKAYKLFKVVNGKLYPPIVKNTGAKETPTNVWIKCGSPEFVEISSSWGKPQVSQTAKGNLSFRAGWHLGELPYAPQFESKKNPGYLSSDKFVWAECDYDATINYQDRAMSYGFTKDGKFTNSAAGLPYRPIGGYYKYRTNPNPNTIAWVITGSMRVNKVLEDSEVEKICKENGVPYLKRPGGDKTLKELGLNECLSEDLNTQEQKQLDEIDELIDDLYKLRQESIQQDGEFGVGNLVFKEMRNMGYLDNLKNLKRKLQSKEMSLGEALLLEKGTDYKKQAIKIISNSGLFDEETSTKIIEGLFRQDIHAFNHAPAWLEKYLKGIARMLVEYCNGDRSKAQSFLTEGVSIFNEYLEWVKQNREKLGNQLDDEFNNNLHYQDVKNKVEEIEKQRDEQSKQELSKMKFNSKSNYTLVPINSFEEFNSKYGGRVTGDGSSDAYAGGGGTAWCHANNKATYDNWTTGGRKFFVLQRNDWKEIPFNEESNERLEGKDDYGNSLIAINTNKYGKLRNATLRCNHVGVDIGADNQYETYAELSRLAGFNVEEEVKKYCEEPNENELPDGFYIEDEVLFSEINYDTNIESFVIPNGVIEISEGAFYNCSSLRNITIPNSVTRIGSYAFCDCSKLTSVVIPEGVTRICGYAFYDCVALTSIEIPNSVTEIGGFAFSNCKSLKNIKIPNRVTYIGNGAFLSCESLTSIELSTGLTSIGANAFRDCTSLTSIEVPNSVKEIGYNNFNDCSPNLTVLTDNEYVMNYCYYNNIKYAPLNKSLKEHNNKPNIREELLLEKGTDYRKQAIKIIVDSGLFSEDTATKIIDGLFRQDIHAFNHAPAWLEKYLKGIARMMVEYCNGDSGKAQQFLLDNVSVFEYYLNWVKANREKVGNQLDDEFINKLSIEELNDKVNKMQEEQDKKSQDELSKMEFGDSNYTLVPIDNYEQMHKLYGGHWTGDGTDEEGEYAGHGGTSWCHTNSENTYKQWVNSGNYKFFVLQRNDWKSIPFDEDSNDEKDGKDDYGNSLIALLISNTGKLKNATLRCNHVGVKGSADNQYETYAELSKLAGFNVQEEVAKNMKFTSNIEHYGDSVRMYLGGIAYTNAESNPKYIIDCYTDGYSTDYMQQHTFSEMSDWVGSYEISNNIKEMLYNLHIEDNLRIYDDLIKVINTNQDEELDDILNDIRQSLTVAVEDGEAVGTLDATHRELIDYMTSILYAKDIVEDGDGFYTITYDEDGLDKFIDDVNQNINLDDYGTDASDYSLEELIEWKLNDDNFNRYFAYADFDFYVFEESFYNQLSELEDELERKKQDYLKKTYGGKTIFDYNDNEQ